MRSISDDEDAEGEIDTDFDIVKTEAEEYIEQGKPIMPQQQYFTVPQEINHMVPIGHPPLHTASAISANVLPTASTSTYTGIPMHNNHNFEPIFAAQPQPMFNQNMGYSMALQQQQFQTYDFQQAVMDELAGQIDPFGMAPPADYVMAMYDQNMNMAAPMGFMAGPPGIPSNVKNFGYMQSGGENNNNQFNGGFDFDLTNYDEALAQMGDLQNQNPQMGLWQ